MNSIQKIKAREILDSRGNPTVEVDVWVDNHKFTASVPSGASTGIHEALELRDLGKKYLGLGVQKAVRNVNLKIAPLLKGKDCTKQKLVDQFMIQLDGTKNKSKLGANALLGVSLAVARAGAHCQNKQLYQYIAELSSRKAKMPQPFFNIINGGKHADNQLCFQEFMISPHLNSFSKNLQAASEIYHILKKELHTDYGPGSTNVGDEGGFTLSGLKQVEEVLKHLRKVIKSAGYENQVHIAIDCAASEFFIKNRYLVDNKKMSKEQLLNFYLDLIKKYNLYSLEDPFQQEDFESFAQLNRKSPIQIVGDDLTVTNIRRLKLAIEKNSGNCLLLKVNQIGTLTEALEAAKLAFKAGWKVMVSHRSGETEDTFIADLAVGLGCGQIKAGAPCRGERVAKYNRLLRIEEEL